MSQFIPTFLHIPKNAGTYVLHVNHFLNELYQKKRHDNINPLSIKRCLVKLKTGGQITTFIFDPFLICESNQYFSYVSPDDPNAFSVNFAEFANVLLNNQFELFSLNIDPVKLGITEDILEIENLLNLAGFAPLYYTITRDPLKRAYSIFNYLHSDASKHEETHKGIDSTSFNDYLASNQIEDSWTIRHLLSMNDKSDISKDHFEQAKKILSNFIVSDIGRTSETLSLVFKQSYNLDTQKEFFDKLQLPKNSTHYNVPLNYSQISDNSLALFKSRAYWDYQLFNFFK